ncbi:hypothetical protein ABT56_20720 [Photobacterium aquae]|uniref:ABC transporter domain-containing protein n=1 Tax=Photobacterium aquae TaxID=1195763 RepID=A0A0J1JM02_9GAMM|nr:ATP-binding cassette domain-containing protein [Photobacterium aquae]KLV03177.1 hypothetical protein ABT56_20720 [Photobacterium aquae]
MLHVNQLAIAANNGGTYLLHPLSFTLAQGEIVGVIGESGSGKSLLAHAMLGHAPKGYRLQGDIQGVGSVALSAQSASVFDPLKSVRQHLSRWLLRSSCQEESTASHHRWSTLGIDPEIAGSYRHQLSGGMGKRACLAQALVQSTSYILADEPCAGLDEVGAQRTYRQLRDKADSEHLGLLIISHNLRQLLTWADRILVLRHGQLVDVTTPAAIRRGDCAPYSRALWEALPENWGESHVDAA